jgi:hypothetical protein
MRTEKHISKLGEGYNRKKQKENEMASEEAPKRDIPTAQTALDTPETEGKPQAKKKGWKEFKGVIESEVIDTIDRLQIVAGVNEYKGNHYVFIGKVTDADFQKAFFSLPAYVWAKAVPILNKYVGSISEIEKKSMTQAVLIELKRLKELGIDVSEIAKQV